MESIIQKALRLILDKFGATYDCIMVLEENGHYKANIETDDAARLIGRNGAVLNAIQLLLKNILWEQNSEKFFVSVDVDNYRKDQEERLLEKVKEHINSMQENNHSETKLAPMSPYFRRLVHIWISNNYSDLTTESIGEGENRAVRVFYN